MFVEMKKTYIGKNGPTLPKGIKQDVTPDELAEKLIKDKYAVKCRSPWDEKANLVQRELGVLKQAVKKIEQEIAGNQLSLKKAKDVADSIPRYERIIKTLQANQAKAQKILEVFAAKNDIPLEKKVDGKEEGKTDGTGEESKSEGDNGNAAGQAAPTGQEQ